MSLEAIAWCIVGGLLCGVLYALLEAWVNDNAWRIDPDWEQLDGLWRRRTTSRRR